VRIRERVHVVRLVWGAVAFLRQGAFVGVGWRVRTPFGEGTVESIQRIIGTYRVRLPWGTLYTLPTGVKPSRRQPAPTALTAASVSRSLTTMLEEEKEEVKAPKKGGRRR
jgi:hypothetical protein